jgi:hypothetical protein
MNPLAFLFALIYKWVPIEKHEFATMKTDAEAWFSGIAIERPENHKPYELWLKKNGEDWRFKLLLACLYVPISNEIRKMLDPTKSTISDNDLTL